MPLLPPSRIKWPAPHTVKITEVGLPFLFQKHPVTVGPLAGVFMHRHVDCPACWIDAELRLRDLEEVRWVDDGGAS
jgi:hypothetical protein